MRFSRREHETRILSFDATVLRLAGLALVALSAAASTSAQDKFTQDELRALPRICLAQQTIHRSLLTGVVPETERQRWAESMGPVYQHFHHYCWALIDLRRASGARGKQQEYHYRSAVGNFAYVQRHADATFPLYPELLLRKGLALRFLGRDAEAATEFTRAIRAKTDYTPAYAALIDLHLDLGDLEGARGVLQEGLRQAPRSKILLGKKEKLEGGPASSIR